MILKGKSADAALNDPIPGYRAYLFYGRDEGRIRENAVTTCRKVNTDMSDPFGIAELSGGTLREDPARLCDEAAALSMTGDRRVVRVRGATDANANAFQNLFEMPNANALVVVEAGDLGKRSKLRVLFEASDQAAAIACYEDNTAGLEDLVKSTLRTHGFRISADATAYLCENLGQDRAGTRQELEKLALYMASGQQTGGDDKQPPDIAIADVRACIGSSGVQQFDDACYAAFNGDIETLDNNFRAILEAGQAPVGVLRATINHALRLHLAAGKIADGTSPDTVIRSLKPPIHFTRTRAFRDQLRLWNVPRLNQSLHLLMDAERDCKTTGLPDTAICMRTLFRIATAAQTVRHRIG